MHMWKKATSLLFVLFLCIAAWGVGCGGDSPGKEKTPDGSVADTGPSTDGGSADNGGTKDEGGTKDGGGTDAKPADDPPKLPIKFGELKKDQWNMIPTTKESGAICSRGSEYAFFVYPGSPDKVIIDFEGGGACWNAQTCGIADALFKDSIDNLKKILTEGGREVGIYAKKDPRNPFQGWTHIFVPYCTGDIHWGDNVKTYTPKNGKDFQINHKGAVNSRTVLKWAYENVKKPDKVFVTGCSAGSYGSIVWSAHIAKQYKDAKIYQMGDSGVGVITDTFLKDSFPSWKAEQAAPAFVDGLDPAKVKIADHDLAYMYKKIAAHFSSHLFSQFNTAFDKTQVFFFEAMGGGKSPQEWNKKMQELIKDITDSTTNFRSFTAPGDKHCIIPYKEFYTYEVDGVKLVDWVKDMISDKDIKSHSCQGDACNPPKP